MKVSLESSCTIKPERPTWNGQIALSEWDQIGYISHIPTIYIYRSPQNGLKSAETITQDLKDSLSRVLTNFYPLAGRLHRIAGGRLKLKCNAMGAEFTDAEADAKLDDLGEFPLSSELHHLVPRIDYEKAIEDIPLLFVQITKFMCGGTVIGTAISHAVANGQGAVHFLTEWARLTRGEPLEAEPFLDRKVLRAGDPPLGPPSLECEQFNPPPLLIGETSDADERKKETTVTMLKLSKIQVEMLKKQANEARIGTNHRPYTRYETITGHIWRCASKARSHKSEQSTGLGIAVDIRKRMQPPVPQRYFGNATIDVVATALSGDLVTRPLGYAASRVREAIDKVTDEYVHSTIDFLKNQEDLSPFQDLHSLTGDEGPFYGNPNLGVTSWLTLPMHGLDFGWGKEIYNGPVTHDFDGDFILFPDHEGDGSLLVRACLQVPHMEVFKKLFHEYILHDHVLS